MAVRGRDSQRGQQLNDRWGVGARHALYHQQGKWFHVLKRFPGALMDEHGYVVFETEAEFRSTAGLQVKKEVFCSRGISSLPKYRRFPEADGSSTMIGDGERIRSALQRYSQGERPWREVRRDWYVLADDGALLPAKYIWALAIDQAPRTFNSREARKSLAQHGLVLVSEQQVRGGSEGAFEEGLRAASHLSDEELRARIERAEKLPQTRLRAVQSLIRNPYVAAAVLRRAKGNCESCGSPAPFLAAASGAPYLEIHHKVRLADGGEDTLENTMAVCPNCHRKEHYG